MKVNKYDVKMFDSNHYLNDGLTGILMRMLTEADLQLELYEVEGITVRSYQLMSWASNTSSINISITVKMSFGSDSIAKQLEVELAKGDTLHQLSNKSMDIIRNAITPIFEDIVMTFSKKNKIKSLINKL